MSLVKLYNLTKKGETLSKKQVDSLASKLGIIHSAYALAFRIILSLLLLFVIILCFIKIDNDVVNIIVLLLGLVSIASIFILKFNEQKIISYLKVLQDFYVSKFSDYEGFESIFVQHQYQRNGYLQNTLAILITDGYDFYLFDDIFKETEYLLPRKFKSDNNKKPTLKIVNPEFVNKRPVYFKLEEISYYSLLKPFVGDATEKNNLGYEFRRYTYTPLKFELDNYCLLMLEDGSAFKLSPDVVFLLRKKASRKERI